MQKITSAGKIAHHSGATNGKKKSRAFVWYLIRLWGSLTAGDLTFVVAMVWLHLTINSKMEARGGEHGQSWPNHVSSMNDDQPTKMDKASHNSSQPTPMQCIYSLRLENRAAINELTTELGQNRVKH